jgi:hypothetical protein
LIDCFGSTIAESNEEAPNGVNQQVAAIVSIEWLFNRKHFALGIGDRSTVA